jgi:hypothetical protein
MRLASEKDGVGDYARTKQYNRLKKREMTYAYTFKNKKRNWKLAQRMVSLEAHI